MGRKSDEKTYSYRLWKNVYSTNQLEIKRDKIISIKEVIDTIESKSEINRLYKTIIKRVEYIRDDNNVEIKVEFL